MYGLIFDVDGVIGNTERLSEESSIQMFRDLYGIEVKAEEFHPFIGTGARRYVEGVAELHGIDIDTDKAVAARHENFVRLLDSGEDIGFPGVHKLVKAAYESPDWKLAVATSSPGAKSRLTLKAARIEAAHFDAYIHGDMVTHTKPHPEIYHTAGEAIGIAPEHCVVVEDAITGVEAAKAAHMHCLAVTNSFDAEKLAKADRIVASLEQVDLALLTSMIT